MDVDTQLRLGVRLLQGQVHMCVFQMFHCFSHRSHIYFIYSSRNGKDLSLCHTSQFTKIKFMVVVRTINANFPYFPLHYSLRKSFIIWVCALF